MAELDEIINQPSESDRRISQLSGRLKEEAEGKAEEVRKREEAEAKLAEAERKAAFSDSFADILATNPAAKDFKADIQAKVMAGYTAEDAAYAVLGKAGKLGTPVAEVETGIIAGGSASTGIATTSEKTSGEMTQEERRAALMERESDLQSILSPRNI